MSPTTELIVLAVLCPLLIALTAIVPMWASVIVIVAILVLGAFYLSHLDKLEKDLNTIEEHVTKLEKDLDDW